MYNGKAKEFSQSRHPLRSFPKPPIFRDLKIFLHGYKKPYCKGKVTFVKKKTKKKHIRVDKALKDESLKKTKDLAQ